MFLSKEGAMKRIIMLAVALVVMLVSIEGCWVPWHGNDRGGGPDRGRTHDNGRGHDSRQKR